MWVSARGALGRCWRVEVGKCLEMENRSSSAPVPVQQEGVVGPQGPPTAQHRGAQRWPGAAERELTAEGPWHRRGGSCGLAELRSGCALAW